jgi:hypothetical protein
MSASFENVSLRAAVVCATHLAVLPSPLWWCMRLVAHAHLLHPRLVVHYYSTRLRATRLVACPVAHAHLLYVCLIAGRSLLLQASLISPCAQPLPSAFFVQASLHADVVHSTCPATHVCFLCACLAMSIHSHWPPMCVSSCVLLLWARLLYAHCSPHRMPTAIATSPRMLTSQTGKEPNEKRSRLDIRKE